MATFYGGEQLVEIKNFANGNSNPATLYTVPSGRYAEVFFKQLRDNGGSPEFQITYNSGVTDTVNSSDVINNTEQFFITLNEGETVDVDGASPITYTILVKEYTKP